MSERVLGIGGVFFRARDLVALRAGVPVDDRRHEDDDGRFGWATDPEGNRVVLWEPA